MDDLRAAAWRAERAKPPYGGFKNITKERSMVKKLSRDAAAAAARKYGFDLPLMLSVGVKTFVTSQTGDHDLVVYRYPTTFAVVVTNLDGDIVERFNFN